MNKKSEFIKYLDETIELAKSGSYSDFLVKERDGYNDDWTQRLWNIVENAVNYEFLE